MKKLLALVFVLIAVIGMIFAVSAADAQKLTGLADVSKFYKADGSEVVGGGMNGGSYMSNLFDGSYGANYNNNVGSYIVTDLNAKLPGGYYVTEIKIYHSNNSNFSLYYTTDGQTWTPIVEKAKVTEATYAVGATALQVKYVFDTCANWVASAKEIEIYGIDPSTLVCLHENMTNDGWTPVPGSATCTGVGKVSQTCPDCGEVQEQISNDVLPLGHDLVSNVTKPGTSISYGEATLNCSRCDYTIDFHGEVELTSAEYSYIGESTKFTNIFVSSIADLWGASTVENMFKNDWVNIGPFNTWVAAGEVDEDEYVILNFKGAIDLTKVRVLVQNDSGGALVISALNSETGEYEEVRRLQTYDSSIGGGSALDMTVPMLGVTTSSIKIQVFSNWRNTNGYYYNRMVIGELAAFGIAEGCGLDADNHECSYDTFVEYVNVPTCQQNGSGVYKCACNATATLEILASEEYHNYIEIEGTREDSTCTVAGSYTGKCEYCEAEATINLEFDLENGHAWTETGRTDSDCENAGSIEYKCDNCEATKSEEIAAKGHKYGEAVVVPSTCKDNGTSTKTCTECGNEEVTTLETTGCAWEMGEIITAPTCGEAGEANYACSVCGDTKVDAVAATGEHTWDDENVTVIVAPGCTNSGVGEHTCTVCGAVAKVTIPATGHNMTEATCTAKSTCLNCGWETGDMLPHEAGEYGSEPSCTGAGICGACGAEFGEQLPHTWSETPWTEPATCIYEGKIYYYCSECWTEDETRTEILPIDTQNGHVDWEGTKEEYPASCIEDGYKIFDCAYCDAVDVKVIVPADPENFHAAMDWDENYINLVLDEETFVALTCQTAGYAKYTCTVCNNYEVVIESAIDPEDLQHVWDDGVAIDGGFHYECDLCDASKDAVTKGTADDPIAAIEGDNDFVYYVEELGYVVYEFANAGKGTLTLTVDATVGVFFGYAWELNFGAEFMTGETTYTYDVDGAFTFMFSLDTENYTLPETFNVSFEAFEYPELALGENTIVLVEDYTPYEAVVSVPGTYTLTASDNAMIYIPDEYGFSMIEELPYVFTVAEGESAMFRVFTDSFTAGEVSVTITNPSNALLNGKYVTPDGSAFFEFADGVLTVTDVNPMLASGYAGTYNYNYNAATGAIVLDPDNGLQLSVNAYTGSIMMFGRMPLSVYVPPVVANIGANSATLTATNYRYNEVKFVFTAPAAGSYEFTGSENFIMVVENMYGAEMVETPFVVELAEGQPFEFIVTTGANPMASSEDTVEFTINEYVAHVCEFKETERVDSTCTAAGYVVYACSCGETKTETLELAAHNEVAIEAIRPTPSTVGYTAGSECADCGAVIKAPVAVNITELSNDKNVNTKFRFAAINLSAQENISVNYKIDNFAGYEKFYVVFVFDGKEYIVDEYTIEASSGRYVFNFAETRPQLMASNIAAHAYVETAEGEYTEVVYDTYSVLQYILGQLKKNNAALTTVMSDILYMGAKTQLYMGVNTNELVTDLAKAEGYTLTPTAFTSIDPSLNIQAATGEKDSTVDWKSVSLAFGASTEIVLKFEATDLEGLKVKITVEGNDEEFYYDASKLTMDGNKYVVYFPGVRSYEYNAVVTATFERDGVQVGRTFTYSVNTFLARNYQSSTYSATAIDLMKAIYIYGESIAAYFA